jgi:hypothetical protein
MASIASACCKLPSELALQKPSYEPMVVKGEALMWIALAMENLGNEKNGCGTRKTASSTIFSDCGQLDYSLKGARW